MTTRRSRGFRPRVEALEDRSLPSTADPVATTAAVTATPSSGVSATALTSSSITQDSSNAIFAPLTQGAATTGAASASGTSGSSATSGTAASSATSAGAPFTSSVGSVFDSTIAPSLSFPELFAASMTQDSNSVLFDPFGASTAAAENATAASAAATSASGVATAGASDSGSSSGAATASSSATPSVFVPTQAFGITFPELTSATMTQDSNNAIFNPLGQSTAAPTNLGAFGPVASSSANLVNVTAQPAGGSVLGQATGLTAGTSSTIMGSGTAGTAVGTNPLAQTANPLSVSTLGFGTL